MPAHASSQTGYDGNWSIILSLTSEVNTISEVFSSSSYASAKSSTAIVVSKSRPQRLQTSSKSCSRCPETRSSLPMACALKRYLTPPKGLTSSSSRSTQSTSPSRSSPSGSRRVTSSTSSRSSSPSGSVNQNPIVDLVCSLRISCSSLQMISPERRSLRFSVNL